MQTNSGEQWLVIIDYPVFISSYLIMITFIVESKNLQVHLPIFKGALSQEELRKLKMLLKITL